MAGNEEAREFQNPIYRETETTAKFSSTLSMGNDSGLSCSRNRLIVLAIAVASVITAAVLITYFASQSDCPVALPTATPAVTNPQNQMSTAMPCTGQWETVSSPIRSSCTLNNECPEDNIMRLPRDVLATHYDIEMKPDIYIRNPDSFTFWAKVTIDMTCHKTTSFIQLNYNKFTIDEDTVTVTCQGQEVNVDTKWSNKTLDQDLYVIQLEEPLMSGEKIQVSMAYSGKIPKYQSRGYSYSDYKINGTWKYMIATQSETTYARELFPCMDDPGLKASYAMSIWRKLPYISLFNMPQKGMPEPKSDGWLIDHYQTTPLMSTYLVAFLVGEYSHVVAPSNHGHDVKIWAPVEYIDNGWASLSASVAGVALDVYDDMFETIYPLPKLDVALVPDKRGAMENWGLILSGMNALIYDSDINGLERERQLTKTMFHEEGHMWWGDLVTCDWWSDIWLNEAYATLYSFFPWQTTHPNWDTETFEEELVYKKLYFEESKSTHAAHSPGVNTKSEAQGMFDAVSYGRTANVLRMMRRLVMSPHEWDKAMSIDGAFSKSAGKHTIIRDSTLKFSIEHQKVEPRFYSESPTMNNMFYLADNAYKSATYKQLLAAINKFEDEYQPNYEIPAADVLDTWIRQMGHPVVTIKTLRDTNHVYASQKLSMTTPYIPKEDEENPSPFGYKWYIPMPYVTSFAPNEADKKTVWLLKNDLDFDIDHNMTSESWILANYGHLGFYRVNYDLDNWNALIQQLWTDHTVIPVENRAALIDDAFMLARAGELDFSIPLRLTTYLYKERDYLPWVALRWVNDNFMEFYLSTMESHGAYREYMRWLLSSIYDDLGWDAKASETEKYISMRKRMFTVKLACHFGNNDCLDHALQTVRGYEAQPNDHKIVNPDTQLDIFCSAVQFDPTNSTSLFVYQLWNDWQDEDIQGERLPYLLSATTCTRDLQQLQWLFDAAMNSDSDMPDSGRQTILDGISRNPVGKHIVYMYLKDHWEDNHQYRDQLLGTATELINNHDDLHEVEMMMEQARINIMEPSMYNSITTRIENNIKFKEEFGPTIDAFLYNMTKHYHVNDSDVGMLLPKNLYPTHYEITLVPDIYHPHHDNFKSWGAVQIYFTAVNKTDVVYLNYMYIKINTYSVMVSSLTSELAIHINDVIERPEKNYIVIFFDREVEPWENVTVSMHFTDIIRTNDTKKGLYWNYYHDKDLQPKYMLGTQLEKTRAEWIFPCIDECGIKSHFTITMGRKAGYQSQSNMPIKRSYPVSDPWQKMLFVEYGIDPTDWYMDEFETTSVVMQTYLVSLAVSDFTAELCQDGKYNDSIWAQPKYVEAGYTNYAANVSAKILNFFDNLFLYKYPLPKQDLIVIPDRTGAMENWGLVTFAPYYMLYDPELSDIYDKLQIARVVGHELTHMWFGDLVTTKYFNDIFLHESYASFYENWAVEHVEPDWDMDQLFFRTRFLAALKADSDGTTLPIRKENIDKDALYTTILYSKGACVLRMMEALVLGEHWNETHQDYLTTYAEGNADMEDYLAIFDKVDVKYNISDELGVASSIILRNWLTQSGYPVVNFYFSTDSNKVRVTQKRFLLNPDKRTKEWYPNKFGYRWEVPVTFETHIQGSKEQYLEMLHQRDGIYHLRDNMTTGSWIVANYDSKGFYRTNYETANWKAIIDELKKSHTSFDVKLRAKLIDDALSLSRAGEMDTVLALSLVEYLEVEDEYAPWYAYSYTGEFLLRMLSTFPDPVWSNYQAHVRRLLTLAYNRLGWTVNDLEPMSKRMARMHIMSLACQFNVADCRSNATQLLAAWKANPSNLAVIHPDLREAVFCSAIEESNNVTSDWDFLFDRYLHFRAIDHFSRARAQIRAGLACVKEKYTYIHYFEMALDKDPMLDSLDYKAVATSVASNHLARPYVWSYLESNWDTMSWGEDLLFILTGYFNTDAEYAWLEEFYANHTVSEQTRSDIQYGVLANIKWRQTNEQYIEEWLESAQKDYI